ncbi:MAG: aminotransferase class I/II-fold pyridoxal phosphate-dependent enzyme [Psychrosphaera sp.]|nr:aminotransferase class I/II-fold pyridoxal phosphate-dependent enzyme [Psychrosphaera sp.]
MVFNSFKHLEYIAALRDKLSQPLLYNLSDSCAQSLNFGQLTAMSDNDHLPELGLGYATIAGSPQLRQTIAQLHQKSLADETLINQASIDKENVTVFCGAQEALFATFNHLLSAGDEIIAITPCYPSLVAVPQQLGVTVKAIELEFERQWQFSIEDVKSRLSDKTRLIVLNSPHNPTGAVLDRTLAMEIIELARQHGIYIISDEVSVWSDFEQTGINHPFLAYEKTVAIGVLSKSFGLAGVRIGWAVSQDKALLQRLREIRGYTSICGSATDEYLATVALNNAQQILTDNNAQIQANIETFARFITRSNGRFEWHPPKAGILALVKSNLTMPVRDLAQALAMKQQTLILPGDLFGIEGNYFRLGLGRADFDQALGRFEAFLGA